MVCTVNDIIGIMESIAPSSMAAEWDNVGLLCGNREDRVRNVMVTLDVTDEVIEEAIDLNINMIVSHHPLMIKPVPTVTGDSYVGTLFAKLIKNNIALYSAHTNLDRVQGGVNDALCAALGLTDVSILEPAYAYNYKKIVTYVPTAYEDAVSEAMCRAGAGKIGRFEDCTFRAAGTGVFTDTEEDDDPSATDETRIEATVENAKADAVVTAICQMHPYDEPVIDVFDLKYPRTEYGLGRVGNLEQSINFNEFVNRVQDALESKALRVAGDPEAMVSRVAVVGGAASEYFPLALNAGAQVFISGEIKHHHALEAAHYGLQLIDAGHYATERVIVPVLVRKLSEAIDAFQYGVDVFESATDTESFVSFT